MDENALSIVRIVDGGVASDFFELVDVELDHGDGFRFGHRVVFRFEFEALGMVAKIDTNFTAGEQLAEDSGCVGVREPESKSILLNLV